MADPETTLRQARENTSTHNCPDCGGPVQCAVEAGYSISSCWCMEYPLIDNHQALSETFDDDRCLCKRCLKARSEYLTPITGIKDASRHQ